MIASNGLCSITCLACLEQDEKAVHAADKVVAPEKRTESTESTEDTEAGHDEQTYPGIKMSGICERSSVCL